MITLDMATTVQAWGKILHARSKNESIPNTWAVDSNGEPTTDPLDVQCVVTDCRSKRVWPCNDG